MAIWTSSDQHWNHSNIIRLAGRPFDSMEEMNRTIIDNWNACVTDDDTIITVGDTFMGPIDGLAPIIDQLHYGTWIYVRGNHCQNNRMRVVSSYPNVEVYDNYVMSYNGVTFFFSHKPDDRPHDLLLDDAVFCYGHIHEKAPRGIQRDVTVSFGENTTSIPGYSYHVGVDTNDFKPVSLDSIYGGLCDAS